MTASEIAVTVIGCVGTICGIAGISAYSQERSKHKAVRKNQKEDAEMKEIEDLKHDKYVDELVSVVETSLNKAITPIATDVKEIKNGLTKNQKATITTLRSNMKTLRDQYKNQGYADLGDKATWNELYDDYKDMGGNHFKEYVNIWKEEVNSLPLEKSAAKKKRTPTKKKQIPLENN